MKSRLGVLVSLLGALGCAGPTEYVQRGTDWKGGYEDVRLKDDLFIVGFSANAHTSYQQAETYLLYRCAEVTHQAGYDHFIVVEGHDTSTAFAVAAGSAGVAQATSQSKPRLHFKIRVGRGPAPAGNDDAYDAMATLRRLDASVERDYTAHPHY